MILNTTPFLKALRRMLVQGTDAEIRSIYSNLYNHDPYGAKRLHQAIDRAYHEAILDDAKKESETK